MTEADAGVEIEGCMLMTVVRGVWLFLRINMWQK